MGNLPLGLDPCLGPNTLISVSGQNTFLIISKNIFSSLIPGADKRFGFEGNGLIPYSFPSSCEIKATAFLVPDILGTSYVNEISTPSCSNKDSSKVISSILSISGYPLSNLYANLVKN